MNLSAVYTFFLEGLFPPYCLVCNKEGFWLCEEHREFFPPPVDEAVFYHLDSIHSAVAYSREPSKLVVNGLKSSGNKMLGGIMAEEILRTMPYNLTNAYIQPMPLHWTRRITRGFNQAEVIAQYIVESIEGGRVSNFVKRKKRTKHQSLLGREERLMNLRGVFGVKTFDLPEVVYLVDDVVATGSSLDFLAQSLKSKGVKEVHGIVFARGGSL